MKNKTRETKRMAAELELKVLGDDGVFTGDLSVYDFIDYGGDVTVKGCFTKTLQESGGKVVMLYQHDMARPIGAMELRDGDKSLECKGILNMEMADAKGALSMMRFNQKNGIKTGLSMGFWTIKDSVKSGIRYLEEVKLLEGSVVTLAANRMCAVTEVKATGDEVPTERKDFAEELEQVQTYDLFSQIFNALYSEACDLIWNAADEADAQARVDAAFDGAKAAFSDYVSRVYMLGTKSQHKVELAAFPDSKLGTEIVASFEKKLLALRAKTTSKEAGPSGAADQSNEPGDAHSDVKPEELKTLVKEIFHG